MRPDRPSIRPGRFHRASLVVVLVGVILGVFGSVGARRIADQSETRLLNDDVGIAASAIQSLANQVHGDLTSSLAVLEKRHRWSACRILAVCSHHQHLRWNMARRETPSRKMGPPVTGAS